MNRRSAAPWLFMATQVLALAPGWAQVVISDKLSNRASAYDWLAMDGACLTAGDGTPSSIPACVGLAYYKDKQSILVGGSRGRLGAAAGAPRPDPDGQGALRLTNGDIPGQSTGQYQKGAIVSKFTFPSSAGLQVTFKTVTYGGNGFWQDKQGKPGTDASGMGADGISFFLMDGAVAPNVGSFGGALGYACSNSNPAPDGIQGGYLGIGIDEFGNFAYTGNVTNTGLNEPAPGMISVRGAGSVNFAELRRAKPNYYPDAPPSVAARMVQATCRSGGYINFNTGGPILFSGVTPVMKLPWNYPLLTPAPIQVGVPLANQQSTQLPLRSAALPLTFNLRIEADGLAYLSFRVNGGTPQTVLDRFDIKNNNAPLPPTLRFGFAASTGGGSNVHEIMCFRAADGRISEGSASTGNTPGAKVKAGAQVFVGSYSSANWWGDVQALALVADANNVLQAADKATWSAACTLTGGPCPAMGNGPPTVTASGPDRRTLLTWSGTAGIPLQFSAFTPALQALLDPQRKGNGAAVVQYWRGNRSGETVAKGPFRTRTQVLGDVIGSSPAWVGPPRASFPDAWRDRLHTTAQSPETPYSAFRAASAGRLNVVYAGANDGMVHGFRAGTGSFDAGGSFVLDNSTANDGREVLGFMPLAALRTLHPTLSALDYSAPLYKHNLFVDATPGSGDLFVGGHWRTWLAGGLGYGGNAGGPPAGPSAVGQGSLYILDVTSPASFSEANASQIVVANLDSGSLRCVNLSTCASAFGSQTGTPSMVRLHDGRWAVIFGNGLNSASGTAGLFIASVDPQAGTLEVRFIDTLAGPTLATDGSVKVRNGIAQATPADLDGDKITDFVYAGDALGNVWRFDLTSDNPDEWSARRLFTTNPAQPVTTGLIVASVPSQPGDGAGGLPRVLLGFGTGQSWPQTLTSDRTFAPGVHSLYGLWDWDMAGWNALASTARYASRSAATGATLAVQTLSGPNPGNAASGGLRYETLSNARVCWLGSALCGNPGNTDIGWRLDFPNAGEQLIANPTLYEGLMVLNTFIPGQDDKWNCDPVAPTGFTLALNFATGGLPARAPFGDGSGAIAAVAAGGVGTPLILRNGDTFTALNATSDGSARGGGINIPSPGRGQRLNWLKVR